ncbi:MAG TPA: GNAT family N-acetyltransferase [Micromonosporaceae bacterium]|jgi:RimJ/RimL family protein N-acetyltransferase
MLPKQIVDAHGVRLRPFRQSDADDIVAGCNDPLTAEFLPHLPRPYTHADALWWIKEGSTGVWESGGAAYAIADPATDRLLGAVGLHSASANATQAEVGYWVGPWARGHGVATAAATALADWAFARGFARLELTTHPDNAASQRVALAAGFQREGERRGAGVLPDGGRYDLIAWSRLATDPAGPTARLLPDLPDDGYLGGQLTDGVIILRPLGPDDADFLHALLTQPEVVATSVPPVAPDQAEIALRCRRAHMRWLAGERLDLVIVDAASGTSTGDIGLYYQEPQTGQAMIGYSMLRAWRGRGYTTRAARLLARWAFAEAGIARLIAGTNPDNAASQRVLERVGFRREGYLRGRLPAAGPGRADDVLYGLLPEDLRDALPTR